MAIFWSGTPMLGSLNSSPFITPPPLPNIISEWAALIPLVVHLASYRNDHIIVGEVSLRGRLSVGLCPKLGTLSAYSKLLAQGRRFLDGASLHATISQKVWDVRWGSVFPAANGAASANIIDYAFAANNSCPTSMPDKIPRASESSGSSTSPTPAKERARETRRTSPKRSYRRCQHLHILRYDRKTRTRIPWYHFDGFRQTKVFAIIAALASVSSAVALCLCGLYGTATMITISTLSQIFCRIVAIQRPGDYLENNENHDAYMLMAAHQNALDWYLSIGDRSVVDTLLNKPMLEISSSKTTRLAATWFRIGHLLQLAAMTFTAAQKGWDGVGFMVLLLIDRALRWQFRGGKLVRRWLDVEGIKIEAKSFQFSGRGIMLGAMQIHSESADTRCSWMDEILVPHPRRDAFIKCLLEGHDSLEAATQSLSQTDRSWVEFASSLSHASADVLKKEIGPAYEPAQVQST